jgi:uncharacterized protein YbbC (DUF1343 family)
MRIETGLAQLIADVSPLRGRRVGLLMNPTAVDAELRHAVSLLSPQVQVTALFGPEHGVTGAAQDMISVDDGAAKEGAIPEFSLYGATEASLTPTRAMLDHVDVLVYDIQDVGSRYYTFVWTMVLAMRAAAEAGKAFIVLDRPNPIGGALVEGGTIAEGYESFVGLLSVANRHGLTAGEIAKWRARVEKLDLDLTVIPMCGWRREMSYAATGLPWVLPSPNMPTVDTALVYPGMCLVEGTELSEGRGTTRPFELAGAPWLDPDRLASALHAFGLPGCRLRPATYLPTFQKHAGVPTRGVQLHVTDEQSFRPYLTGVAFLKACRDQAPERFAWRTRAYEFADKIPAIDLLCGSPAVREGIDAGASLGDLVATWTAEEAEYRQAQRELLMYE